MLIVTLPLNLIEPNSWNSNELTTAQREAMRRTLERDGFLQPLVVRPLKPDGAGPMARATPRRSTAIG